MLITFILFSVFFFLSIQVLQVEKNVNTDEQKKKKITKSHPLLLELETSLVFMVYDYSSTYTEFTLDPGPTIPNG